MVKVKRIFPAPASLETEAKKVAGKYDKPDVIKQLQETFHNKCYICEMNNLQEPEIEHLLPHKNGKYPDRKFDWNNLFWSCGHCNKVKNQEKYEKGIIDCCVDDPEKLMLFRLQDGNVEVIAKYMDNEKAVLTSMLVYEVFNLKNTGMRIYKSDMRLRELNKEMHILYDNLEALKKNPNSKVTMRKLKALLRKESKFAAFKRNYIRENKKDYAQLLSYVED